MQELNICGLVEARNAVAPCGLAYRPCSLRFSSREALHNTQCLGGRVHRRYEARKSSPSVLGIGLVSSSCASLALSSC
jgi:hypothetical protein